LRGGGSRDFHVDGYHKTLFQVELPPSLPQDVVEELTKKFEGYLWIQLKVLMMEVHRRSEITPSGQSVNDFSPNSSDGEEEGETAVKYRGERDFPSIKQLEPKRRR
jgi:hypothetical protein